MDIKKKLISDSSKFSLGTIVSNLINVAKGLVVARFLGPSLYGIWHTFSIILEYGRYSDLGMARSLSREVPYLEGKGERREVKNITNTVFASMSVLALVSAFILLAASFFPDYTGIVLWGVRIVALILILQQLYFFFTEYLRAKKNFALMSKVMVLFSFTNICFVLLLIKKYHIFGVLAAVMASYALCLAYMYHRSKITLKPRLDLAKSLKLFKIGFPLMIIALAAIILRTVDRLLIISLLDSVALGYYAIGVMIATFVYYIPSAIDNVMYPHILEQYGKKESVGHLRGFFEKPTYVIAFLTPFVVGVALLTVSIPVRLFLPEYLPGMTAIKLLIVNVFFTSISGISVILLIALRKHYRLLAIQGVAIISLFLIDLYLLTSGWGISGVALGNVITYSLYSVAVISYAFRHYAKNLLDTLKFLSKVYLPYFYTLIVLGLLSLTGEGVSLYDSLLLTAAKVAVFTLLSLPLLYKLNKLTGIFHELRAFL